MLETSFNKVLAENEIPLDEYDDSFDYDEIIHMIILPLQEAKSLESRFGQSDDAREYAGAIEDFLMASIKTGKK